uniref:Putative adenylate cyclase type 3-like protein panstrongylus megistus n=2 Tax=Rhodnius TaxID=13248 RepID=A0A4P6DG39_RHOPR
MGRKKKKGKQSFLDSTRYNKQSCKDIHLPTPRYLVLSKDHSQERMTDMPSSLLTNIINNVAGKVNSIKKQKDGTVLIETKSDSQSAKLLQLRHFPPKVPVRVTPHRWLNYSKGVVKCWAMNNVPVEEMKKELESQSVVDVKPIMTKLVGKDGKCTFERSSSYILTFTLPTLPKVVNIGFFTENPVPYVPQPKMCYKCYQFGHISKFCKTEKQLCGKCLKPEHVPRNCSNSTVCANCSQEFQSGHSECLGYMIHRKITEIDCILKNVNLDE